jgi:hypothetical protein
MGMVEITNTSMVSEMNAIRGSSSATEASRNKEDVNGTGPTHTLVGSDVASVLDVNGVQQELGVSCKNKPGKKKRKLDGNVSKLGGAEKRVSVWSTMKGRTGTAAPPSGEDVQCSSSGTIASPSSGEAVQCSTSSSGGSRDEPLQTSDSLQTDAAQSDMAMLPTGAVAMTSVCPRIQRGKVVLSFSIGNAVLSPLTFAVLFFY